jgi:hypothetical protein
VATFRGRDERRPAVRIRIVGTEEECQIATDRIARIFDVRRAPRPTWIEGFGDKEKFQVQFDARLREQES